jgi:hypothetical protein
MGAVAPVLAYTASELVWDLVQWRRQDRAVGWALLARGALLTCDPLPPNAEAQRAMSSG